MKNQHEVEKLAYAMTRQRYSGNDAGQFMSKNHISPDYRHFIWTNDRNISLCLCGTYSVFNIYEQGMGKYWK